MNWNLPNVINFYHTGLDDEANSHHWKTIFKAVGLLLNVQNKKNYIFNKLLSRINHFGKARNKMK